MRFTILNETFEIRFQHDRNPVRVRGKEMKAATHCKIFRDGQKHPISIGTAFCSPSDNYCREQGRVVSLRRALEISGIHRDNWKIAFDAYNNRKPKKLSIGTRLLQRDVQWHEACAKLGVGGTAKSGGSIELHHLTGEAKTSGVRS